MLIEISSAKGRIYHHRVYFTQNGMKFVKRSYGKSFYTKKVDEDEKIKWVEYCDKHNLKILVVDESYLRSSTYRKDFLATKKNKWTLCAYCGMPIRTEKITVDHIIPVDKAKKSNYAKWLLKMLNIENVNDMRNLVGACKSCNSKKGAKMGLWVLLGYFGKSTVFWCFRWLVRVAFLFYVAQLIC